MRTPVMLLLRSGGSPLQLDGPQHAPPPPERLRSQQRHDAFQLHGPHDPDQPRRPGAPGQGIRAPDDRLPTGELGDRRRSSGHAPRLALRAADPGHPAVLATHPGP